MRFQCLQKHFEATPGITSKEFLKVNCFTKSFRIEWSETVAGVASEGGYSESASLFPYLVFLCNRNAISHA